MKRFALKYGVYFLLGAVLLFMALVQPVFFTPSNLQSLLVQATVTGVLSIGMTYIILTGAIDISVGSIMYLSGVCASLLITATGNVLLSVGAALIVGVVIGTINGFAVAYLGLPSMIATLGMQSLARGIGHILVKGQSVLNLPDQYKAISQGKLFGVIPASIFICVVLMVLALVVLYKTPFGHYIYAIGNNRDAADASGINSKKILFFLFLISGVLCAVGGVMMTARLGASTVDIGEGIEFTCITAVALGGTSLYGGKGGLWGTVVGVLIVAALENIMRLTHVSAYLYDVVWGSVIFIAVFFDLIRKSAETRRPMRKKAAAKS